MINLIDLYIHTCIIADDDVEVLTSCDGFIMENYNFDRVLDTTTKRVIKTYE